MEKINKFIEQSKLIHTNKYDYSLVVYKSTKTKVKIICPIHGEFEQSPEKHISRKQGCPKCSKTHKLTKEGFINKSNLIHNNKYDYSLVEYNSANKDVVIICPDHGKFQQRASVHMLGSGCPKCVGKNKTNEEIINKFISVNGDKYDYSLIDNINISKPLKIICKKHGVFEQSYTVHKKGHGCPKCVGRHKTNEQFINEVKLIHNNKYDYSLVDYKLSSDIIKINCPIHGEFNQRAVAHLQGRGCSKCKGLSITDKKTKTKEQFIDEVKLIHNDKYDYSLVDYDNCKKHVKIICNEHGIFEQSPDSHIQGTGCPKCGLKFDKSEGEVKDFLKSLNLNIIENSKTIISPLELDIYIPSHNIAIEFDGLYWHSELYKPSNYHLNKTELCEKQDIQLIHLFEDEWNYKQDIVKSRIKNILGLTENKIFARKCIIKEVNKNDKAKFLDNNHIQGTVASSINIGLYYNDELVSLMTFGKGRIALGGESNQYELIRFCNKLNTNVIGGADKLLKYFIKTYKPKEIISYADRRWSLGNLYDKLKFDKTNLSAPNYWYIINNKRKHRFAFRKSILVNNGYDINKTEHQIMLERKIFRIYDCGTIVYKKTLDY
jgi:hypothetical protein